MKNLRKPDDEIVALFRTRDEAAIRETQRAYGKYLLKIAAGILGDERDCEECENDVYLRLWNSIPPEKPTNFKAYLIRLTRNAAIDRLRERTALHKAVEVYEEALDELCDGLVSARSAEDDYDDRRLGQLINRFVHRLSRKQRYIFVSRYYLGRSIKEICDGLPAAESTVYAHLSDMKTKLKEYLIKEGYDHA